MVRANSGSTKSSAQIALSLLFEQVEERGRRPSPAATRSGHKLLGRANQVAQRIDAGVAPQLESVYGACNRKRPPLNPTLAKASPIVTRITAATSSRLLRKLAVMSINGRQGSHQRAMRA